MKIAIVRQRYNPYGGAERFVERALGALANEGAEVTLITRNWDGAPREGFRQITCDPAYSRLLGGRTARDRSFAACAQAEMGRGGFDITQSHERIPGCMIFRAGDGVHAAWLAHRARVLGPLQRLAQKLSGYHRYVLSAEKAMFEHPALRAVICNSPMVAAEVSSYYGLPADKLPVIYNGVDTAAFHPSLADEFRAATRAQAAIPQDAPLLLFVGSGFERKGVPQLLRAFAAATTGEAHLVIVGADRKLKAMQALRGPPGAGPARSFHRPREGCPALVRRGRRLRAADAVRSLPECGAGGAGLRTADRHQHDLRRAGLGESGRQWLGGRCAGSGCLGDPSRRSLRACRKPRRATGGARRSRAADAGGNGRPPAGALPLAGWGAGRAGIIRAHSFSLQEVACQVT